MIRIVFQTEPEMIPSNFRNVKACRNLQNTENKENYILLGDVFIRDLILIVFFASSYLFFILLFHVCLSRKSDRTAVFGVSQLLDYFSTACLTIKT